MPNESTDQRSQNGRAEEYVALASKLETLGAHMMQHIVDCAADVATVQHVLARIKDSETHQRCSGCGKSIPNASVYGHVAQCDAHPSSAWRLRCAELEEREFQLRKELRAAKHALKQYEKVGANEKPATLKTQTKAKRKYTRRKTKA